MRSPAAYRHSAAQALIIIVALLATACSSSSPSSAQTPSSTRAARDTTTTIAATPASIATDRVNSAQPSSAPEGVAFFYQRIPLTDLVHRIGRARIVVAGPQNSSAAEAAAIKATGAKAYRYVQTYWYPATRALGGLNIGEHADYAFCREGSTPAVGRTDALHTPWWFLDMNEQAVQEDLKLRLAALRRKGWDGVFFDRGYAALTGIDDANYDVWNRVSSCTEHPVRPQATFADSYVSIVQSAHDTGLETMFNYGVSPFDSATPLRPNPRDTACVQRDWSHCARLDDAWTPTNWILDEAPAHQHDELWLRDQLANQANEQDRAHGGQVVGLLTGAVLQGGDRDVAYYEWARARLYSFPVGINTGDLPCPNTNTPCNRHGLYPELTSVTLGQPVDPAPVSDGCNPSAPAQCLWTRHYERGVVVVNTTPQPKSASVTLGVAGCRYLLDVRTGQVVEGGRCVTRATIQLGPWSGGPIQYSTQPF